MQGKYVAETNYTSRGIRCITVKKYSILYYKGLKINKQSFMFYL